MKSLMNPMKMAKGSVYKHNLLSKSHASHKSNIVRTNEMRNVISNGLDEIKVALRKAGKSMYVYSIVKTFSNVATIDSRI